MSHYDISRDDIPVRHSPDRSPEHLVGVFGGAQLVAEAGRDARLHAVDPLVVPAQRRLPRLAALLADVQRVHVLDLLVRQLHLLRRERRDGGRQWRLNLK